MSIQTLGQLILIISISFGALSFAKNTDEIFWQAYSKQTLKQLKTQEKPILILACRPGCQWCKKMQNSFQDPHVQELIVKHFAPITVDIDKNPEIVEQYKLTLTPSLIILNSKGDKIAVVSGYLKSETLYQKLNQTISK